MDFEMMKNFKESFWFLEDVCGWLRFDFFYYFLFGRLWQVLVFFVDGEKEFRIRFGSEEYFFGEMQFKWKMFDRWLMGV